MLLIEQLQKYGREYGRYEYEEHGHYHELAGQGVCAELRAGGGGGDYQCNFAPGHHAYACNRALLEVILECLGNCTAADYLAYKSHQNCKEGKQNNLSVHASKGYVAYAYVRKEHGREHCICIYVDLLVGVYARPVRRGEDYACKECAGYVCNSEDFLCQPCVEEAYDYGEYGESVGVGPSSLHPAEELGYAEAQTECDCEECDYHYNGAVRGSLESLKAAYRSVCRTALCDAAHYRQNYDAYYVVYDCRRNYRRAELSRNLAELLQNRYGYCNRSSRKDCADEDAAVDVLGAESYVAEGQTDEHAQHHGNGNARARHERCGKACLAKCLYVRLETRREHEEEHAYLGENLKTVGAYRECLAVNSSLEQEEGGIGIALDADEAESAEFAEDGGAYKYAGNYVAEYLGKSVMPEQKSEELREEQDYREYDCKTEPAVDSKRYHNHAPINLLVKNILSIITENKKNGKRLYIISYNVMYKHNLCENNKKFKKRY